VRTRVFLNPAAGRGRAARLWPELRSRLEGRLGPLELVRSERPGHLTALARAAVADGVRRFIAIGGDGSVNEVLNGMLDAEGRLLAEDSVLCPVPAGTANELCRALGHLQRSDGAIDAASGNGSRRIDLTMTECRSLDGDHPVRRFGYLATSFGSAAQISHDTSRSRVLKRFGGRFSYFAVTLIVTMSFRPRIVRLAFDGGASESRKIHSGLCCNTANAGGGMLLAPGAEPDDGRLDYVEFGDMTRRDVLLQPPSWLYRGEHIRHPKVRKLALARLRAESDIETLVDVDGETVGRLPLTVSVLPRGFAVGV